MSWLLRIDGAAFVLIGLVVLATPSPVPALVRPPTDDHTLAPFKDTRRLLASQFIGGGALALAVGAGSPSADLLRGAAVARLVTLLLVLAINASQLRAGHWKRAPLYVITATLGTFAVAYATLLVGGATG